MKIEQQVVSLEIAQRLAALGVEQKESHFVWYETPGGRRKLGRPDKREEIYGPAGIYGFSDIAAYTVPELVELLGPRNFGHLDGFEDGTFGALPSFGDECFIADTMADALALLLEKVREEKPCGTL